MSRPVILYDGVCGLCDRFVQFVLRRDREALFRFAPLQGPLAARLLGKRGIDPKVLDTVYLALDPDGPGERLLSKAEAVLTVVAELGPGWRLLACARALPRPLLDWGYGLVAARRYRLFGRFDACPAPRPQWRSRFID